MRVSWLFLRGVDHLRTNQVTACNIFTDITFATLPIPLIWSLQLQRRVRLYLIVILSGGYW